MRHVGSCLFAAYAAASLVPVALLGADEALLVELRQRQQTPHGRVRLRERTKVEHSLAHIGYWQGRRARYLGPRTNLFDLRRAAVVHNLHVIARQPPGSQKAT